ncbi:MAG TPA: VWA domain-containing protein [Phycisphaerae bacterium]|nr:VWA domain-containing protein [Phycisphaerae bacterium]
MVPQPSSSNVCVSDASLAVSDERAWDRMMGWVALYIPTYGTSVVLHLAVGLLLAFMVTWPEASKEPWGVVTGRVVPVRPPREVVRRPRLQHESRLRPTLPPSTLVQQVTPNLTRDIATNYKEMLQVIGIGSGGDRIGSLSGPGPDTIFDRWDELHDDPAGKVVYVVDRSGSMTDSIDFVKAELRRSIMELGDDVEFHVIFYSSGPPVEMPTRRLVAATDRNKQLAFEFVDGIIPQGETDPSKALERAFAVRPEAIYLLTDGEFDRGIIGLVKRLNAGRRTRVFTIGFLYDGGTDVLKEIARDSGGQYTFVSEQDLASILGGV